MIRDLYPRRKSASKGKGDVKPAAPKFRTWFWGLDREIRAILIVITVWLLLCVYLFINSTEQDAIELDCYYDDVRTPETERLT